MLNTRVAVGIIMAQFDFHEQTHDETIVLKDELARAIVDALQSAERLETTDGAGKLLAEVIESRVTATGEPHVATREEQAFAAVYGGIDDEDSNSRKITSE